MKAKMSILFFPVFFTIMTVSCHSNFENVPNENTSELAQTILETTETLATMTKTQITTVQATKTIVQDSTEELSNDYSPTPTTISDEEIILNSENWQEWPILPIVSKEMMDVYQLGLEMGTDPNTFSVFGDCQSLPEYYMGGYETGETKLDGEYHYLQSTIERFEGSFNRESVTIKKGTTVAAILWEGWIDADTSICEYGETPLECEVRVHNPSIVMINLGTHWEVRNEIYLRKILEELISRGIVPIISTKADTREGEAWINAELVQAASEYHVPVWNFWLAVQLLENHGMKPDDRTYLTEEGLETQRLLSLQSLDSVFRQLNEMPLK
ncbi:MAG: hypothetical protein K8R40_04130 [Anaerolineaceae bacterium]|nr:hypothetical protein [Anaerolineaceae bacterium]